MKLKATRIVKHHNRGLFAAKNDTFHKTEIDLRHITNCETVRVKANENRIVVTDIFQTEYIIGTTFNDWTATRMVSAINERDMHNIYWFFKYHIIASATQAKQISILQSMREREQARRNERENEIVKAAAQIKLADDEIAAIEAA